MAKNPRIVIEEKKDGIRVRIDGAHSRDHALYMIAQAQVTMILSDTKDKAEGEEDAVQELSSEGNDGEPNVQ